MDREEAITKATAAASQVVKNGPHTPGNIRIRASYIEREDRASTGSDRKQSDRRERPPATRILTSRGSQLRFSLLTLFEAQSRTKPGGKPSKNTRPLTSGGGSEVGWVDLLATDTRENKASRDRKRSINASAKMDSQLKTSIEKLADPTVELVQLDAANPHNRRFENFALLHEGGRRDVGLNVPYVVPQSSDLEDTFTLPTALFTQGWIHVLSESELAMLVMCARLSDASANRRFRISGDDRLQYHGISPTTYDNHLLLSSLGLLEVVPHKMRTSKGKVVGYEPAKPNPTTGKISKRGLVPHEITLLAEGFDRLAFSALKEALE